MRLIHFAIIGALALATPARAAAPAAVLVDPTTFVLIRPTAAQFAGANNLGGSGGGSYFFTATDFNESGSTISLDFANAQKATSLLPGFLSAADWITFNAKAPTASPTFTGTPAGPTAAADTNTTQLATTAFVIGQAYLKATTAASTYQGLDADLTAIAGLATTSFGRGLLIETSAATLRATLDLEAGTDFLAYPTGTPSGSKFLRDDNTWQSIAGGGDALVANPLSQFAATTSAQLAGVLSDEAGTTGGFVRAGYLGTAATEAATAFQAADGDLTTYANITPSANVQSLLGAADYSAMRTLLALVPGTNVQAYDADLTTYAGITPSANIQTFLGAATYAAMRTQLGLVISTDVQAYDSDLTTWGGITPGTGVATFLATPTSANLAAALTNETGTGVAVFNSDPLILTPNAAMGALAIDVTKRVNTKTLTGTTATLTFSATPTAGTVFGLVLTGHTSDCTVTIPSSYSYVTQAASTSFVMPANGVAEISWRYDGSVYRMVGEPRTFADLAAVTVVATDKLALHDVSTGTDGVATVSATVLAGLPAFSGDATTSAGASALTLATVNSNVGTFGSATAAPAITLNGKGLATAASNITITPAIGSITGLGTGVATGLGVNVGSAGAVVLNGGALGTPSSGNLSATTAYPLGNLTGAGTGVLTALGVNAGTSGAFLRTADRIVTFVLTIDTLADSMNYDIGFVGAAFTVTEIRGVHFGSGLSSPSIVATVKHGTDRTSGTTIEAVTVTSSTTGTSVTSGLDDATVPANSFIWVETSGKSGTTNDLTIIVRGTYD